MDVNNDIGNLEFRVVEAACEYRNAVRRAVVDSYDTNTGYLHIEVQQADLNTALFDAVDALLAVRERAENDSMQNNLWKFPPNISVVDEQSTLYRSDSKATDNY